MSEYAINVDWTDDKWEFVGRQFEEAKNEEIEADAFYPMMNYAYELRSEPSEEKIKEIHEKTNLTVVKDSEEEIFYLALTGGGMDLSQDIALAYIIAEGWLPVSLLRNVSTQKGLSISTSDFEKILKPKMIKQLEMECVSFKDKLKEWEEAV